MSLLSPNRPSRPALSTRSSGASLGASSSLNTMPTLISPTRFRKLRPWKLSYAGRKKSEFIKRADSPTPLVSVIDPYVELKPADGYVPAVDVQDFADPPPPARHLTRSPSQLSDGEKERLETGYDWTAETDVEDLDPGRSESEEEIDVDAYSWIDPSVIGSDALRTSAGPIACIPLALKNSLEDLWIPFDNRVLES